jgi:hypothetical protein
MTKALWLILLAGLVCGCIEKKCAQLDYKHKDGSVGTSKKYFGLGEDVEVSSGSWVHRVADPPAEERRLAWMNEQPKEGVVKVTLTDE